MEYRGPPPPPPRYEPLAEDGAPLHLRPPPNRRNLPRNLSRRDRGGGCCCGCLCWCCCFLLLIIVVIVVLLVLFFVMYKPKAPSYSVDNLSISRFELNQEKMSLYAQVVATVRAENPNDMIGISYGKGSKVMVMYNQTVLCSGELPSFYQGHHNKTMLRIVMEGHNGMESKLTDALKETDVPIDVYVHVPVGLRLGDVDLRQVKVNVLCSIVVDKLTPNAKVDMKSAKYKVNVEF